MSDLPQPVWLVFAAVIGACIGSFLNVVIYRLPLGQSLVSPPSRCPKCDTRLNWYDNIPVFGWLLLRGRCRQCRNAISIQYPIVEAITALLFVLALRRGVLGEAPDMIRNVRTWLTRRRTRDGKS